MRFFHLCSQPVHPRDSYIPASQHVVLKWEGDDWTQGNGFEKDLGLMLLLTCTPHARQCAHG